MICINCSHPNTAVRNSRPNKKTPLVWRRRQCTNCRTIFTTYERPSLADNKNIYLTDKNTDIFNLGRLIQSIARAFSHDMQKARYDSLSLAQTVETKLSMLHDTLTPELITQTTYETLKRFDELAAIQYAAKHHLITSVRRRGRPSLSSPDL